MRRGARRSDRRRARWLECRPPAPSRRRGDRGRSGGAASEKGYHVARPARFSPKTRPHCGVPSRVGGDDMTTTGAETGTTDWAGTARELGPAFAERAAEHDASDSFVADNYA